jgi:putative phosphoesterase
MKIVVLSDTHIPSKVKALPEQLLEELGETNLIIHAGDMVDIEVYKQLKKYAPVRAVSGNVDKTSVRKVFPEKQTFTYLNYKIGLIHGHQFNNGIINKLNYQFPECDIIIFGHTHKPYNDICEETLLFNPGSPTDKRLQPNYSYGIISLEQGINAEIIMF